MCRKEEIYNFIKTKNLIWQSYAIHLINYYLLTTRFLYHCKTPQLERKWHKLKLPTKYRPRKNINIKNKPHINGISGFLLGCFHSLVGGRLNYWHWNANERAMNTQILRFYQYLNKKDGNGTVIFVNLNLLMRRVWYNSMKKKRSSLMGKRWCHRCWEWMKFSLPAVNVTVY